MSEELNEIEEVSEIDTEEQKRIEHENFLKSFPEGTIFYQDFKDLGDIKYLEGVTDNPALADALGILDNHYHISELTLIKGIFYLKGYEKPDDTEALIIEEKARLIDSQLENLLDETVHRLGNYKNIETCIGYFNSTNEKYRREAIAANVWRDNLYSKAEEILEKVKAGEIDYRDVNLDYIVSRVPPLDWDSEEE